MKALLALPRWNELEGTLPSTGRPHLDLLLQTVGFTNLELLELDPENGLDEENVANDVLLLLVQGEPGGRMRRSLLSSYGLSLGLDGEDSDRLRVVGARQLRGRDDQWAGFVARRKGRLVAYCERSVWDLRHELINAIQACQMEETPSRRARYPDCWLVEGASNGMPGFTDSTALDGDALPWGVRHLPDGDTALLVSANLGEEARRQLQADLGERLYALSPQPLEEVLGELLTRANLKVALAESCTAGLAAARLAAVPGSSAYLHSGFVTYSNDSKLLLKEVTTTLLERWGAVSAETAMAMARGALNLAEADIAVAITGIAGPGGGSPDKPVGTVQFAAVARDGGVITHHAVYSGGRNRIRYQASQTALHLLRRLAVNRT